MNTFLASVWYVLRVIWQVLWLPVYVMLVGLACVVMAIASGDTFAAADLWDDSGLGDLFDF